VRTLLFGALVPATILVLIPAMILNATGTEGEGGVLRLLGLVPLVLGIAILAWCFAGFIVEGEGTPAPYDPPHRLVTGRLYGWMRNPMYVAVTTILVGEALFYGSLLLLLWAAVAWIAFNFFVVLYEEPTLQRRFGPAYETYMEHVPRWIPSRPRIITPHPQMKLATLVYALRDEQVPWCVVPPTRIAGCGSRRAASSSPANRPRSVRYAKCAKRRVSRSMIPCCAR